MVAACKRRKPTAPREVGGGALSPSEAPDPTTAWTVVAVVIVSVAVVTLAAASGILSDASRIILYLPANLILTIDVGDLLVRLWVQRLHGGQHPGPSVDLGLTAISNAERGATLHPYAVVASVHDESDDIDRFVAALSSLRDRVWLIDDASGDSTLLRLRREGWNCLAGTINRNKPAALKHLLLTLPPEIETIVVMDPDVRWAVPAGSERVELERVISALRRSGTHSTGTGRARRLAGGMPGLRIRAGVWPRPQEPRGDLLQLRRLDLPALSARVRAHPSQPVDLC